MQEFKFGILLPKNVDDAFRIDHLNDNYFWRTAIEKELKTVYVAYKLYKQNRTNISPEQIRADRKKHLVGYKEITCHFVSDVKLDGSSTRNARFCANESKTDVPKSLSYSSVVSRGSVYIAFLLASLSNVEVSACDISGAYLNAPVGEKVWFVAGSGMGARKGMAIIITRALYGLKTSAKAWSEFFGKSLKEMGYTPCVANPDV